VRSDETLPPSSSTEPRVSDACLDASPGRAPCATMWCAQIKVLPNVFARRRDNGTSIAAFGSTPVTVLLDLAETFASKADAAAWCEANDKDFEPVEVNVPGVRPL